MRYDYGKLSEALKAAKKAAAAELAERKAKAENPLDLDGGTCNFDCVAFTGKGLRVASVEKAAAMAGVAVMPVKRYGRTEFWVGGIYEGMANLRTKMMEAAKKAMREAAPEGVEVFGYYAMD